jgi:hypothetical protein
MKTFCCEQRHINTKAGWHCALALRAKHNRFLLLAMHRRHNAGLDRNTTPRPAALPLLFQSNGNWNDFPAGVTAPGQMGHLTERGSSRPKYGRNKACPVGTKPAMQFVDSVERLKFDDAVNDPKSFGPRRAIVRRSGFPA